jgi:hypothetical protein
VNIEEVLEALSDIETPPGSDDESEDVLDDTGEESSSTDEGSEGKLESQRASQRAIGHIFPGFCKGERKGKSMQNCRER